MAHMWSPRRASKDLPFDMCCGKGGRVSLPLLAQPAVIECNTCFCSPLHRLTPEVGEIMAQN